MAIKFNVYNECDIKIGEISATKAKRAVGLGIASRKRSDKFGINTNLYTIKEFEKKYSEKLKDKSKKSFCWECGKEVSVSNIFIRTLCEPCAQKHSIEMNECEEEYGKLKAKLLYEKAITLLSKQEKPLDMRKYREAALALNEYIKDNYKKFDSSYEIATAMILIKNKISIKIQPTIGTYQADFVLKEEKVVLEIDGERHKNRKEYDFKRDIEIRNILGQEWEIVRIPTTYVENNITMLYDAIMEMKAYKVETRNKNNGILPEWYSDREKEGYRAITNKN